jgi:hypothetical protein
MGRQIVVRRNGLVMNRLRLYQFGRFKRDIFDSGIGMEYPELARMEG